MGDFLTNGVVPVSSLKIRFLSANEIASVPMQSASAIAVIVNFGFLNVRFFTHSRSFDVFFSVVVTNG
jgi:hypothetical protein